MDLVCLDLEGVLIPEIWIAFAEKTGIEALKATTRDIPDYHVLMQQRLAILAEHKLKLRDIQDLISTLEPVPGAAAFLHSLRASYQVIILSDTFYEFAMPFMAQLDYPTLLCHRLSIDAGGAITDYKLRQQDPKRKSVQAFQSLNYRVFAAGDSYNDTGMLSEADCGFLFRAPRNIMDAFPQFPATNDFNKLQDYFDAAAGK